MGQLEEVIWENKEGVLNQSYLKARVSLEFSNTLQLAGANQQMVFIKKKKCPMEWSLDGDAESRKTLSEMCYLRKSWGTGRICKMKA